MNMDLREDPINSAVKELIEIFRADLSSVSFPDVNGDALEKSIDQVMQKSKELDEAIAKVAAAKEVLEASQQELNQKCQRALAYAKVYAEDKDELLEKLMKINFGKNNRQPKKVIEKRIVSDSDDAEKENETKKPKAKKSHDTETVSEQNEQIW